MLEAATFYKFRWNRMAYKLARDEKGTYYFVDHLREAKRDFHLWVGPRGAMKQQQMTNIVSDSVGDIFATKSGELRLVLNDLPGIHNVAPDGVPPSPGEPPPAPGPGQTSEAP